MLIGHPYAVLGRAEDIRTAASAFDEAAIPFALRNLYGEYGRELAGMHKEFDLMHREDSAASRYRANLLVLNADEMEMAWEHQRTTLEGGAYNIGYWAWELSQLPDAWLPALTGLDEIWAPSRFIQQAIADKADCPVIWMPLAVEHRQTETAGRDVLGLPDDRFLFLFFFDFRSFVSRKNPMAVVRAFEQAFPRSDESVGLVIKTNGMSECSDAYEAFKSGDVMNDPRILWIDRVMDDREIRSLVSGCDCFVSLHRSEGFGRGLAEAMLMSKPVIATGYSGNLDFTNEENCCLVDYVLVPVEEGEYPFGAGQLWADADVDMAAGFMRALVEDPALAREKGEAGARYIRRHHSFAAVGARYRRRLEQLGLVDRLNG
ncbi:glycosyltransferase family 4 protein [Thiocapsa sp. UBA6158]|uniref:glycosyltransferase family 4 protein n=1 Tax=Thiocapsa sp. UBA6158 TaxID=1947692 RepID=UPI0025D91D17|nr:glycosyltransferase family 4 protein [Thiocapsa sp. UBA6158]